MTRNVWKHVAAGTLGWNLITLLRFHAEPAVLYMPDAIAIVVMVVAIYMGFIKKENAVH